MTLSDSRSPQRVKKDALITRVIPVLLVQRGRLVKTVQFGSPTYLGDPINAIRIFNEKEVDELVLLDISATTDHRGPDFGLVERLAGECFMPLAYGGGIATVADVRQLVAIGAEKVILNTHACARPDLVAEAASLVGSQSVVAAIDTRARDDAAREVLVSSGRERTGRDPVQWAMELVALGAGEIFLNSVDRDGTMTGYDIPTLRAVAEAVAVPVIACGGAGSLAHFAEAVHDGGASAVAAGSYFVFYGRHRAVLVTYPRKDVLERTFADS
jgi:cyclase